VRMLYGSKSTDDILLRCGINQQLCFRYSLSHASATHSRMLPLPTLACFRYPLSHASATHSRMHPSRCHFTDSSTGSCIPFIHSFNCP
jgi:hypothetical protein